MSDFYKYYSLSEAWAKREFNRRKQLWKKEGECRWILPHEDLNREGRSYPMHRRVRIGDRRWQLVPRGSLSEEEQDEIWQNLPRIVYPRVQDVQFEVGMSSLPKILQTHVILEATAPHMENVSGN